MSAELDGEIDSIRRVLADAEQHQSDVEPFIDLHEPEVIIVNIAGRRVLGRDTLRRAMEQAVASPLAKVLTKIEIEDVRFVRPDVAIVSCIKHVSDERDAADSSAALPAAGSLTYVMAKGQDGWRIALAQTTPIAT